MTGEERRMLFDIRGRRKNVVRVVYAILALLMGGSLFIAVGPFNIAELFNTGSSAGSASEVFDEQAERIERRLIKNPQDEAQLLALTRVRISSASAKSEPGEGEAPLEATPEARDDYAKALEAWDRYLEAAGDEPNPLAAQLVAGTFFSLAETGSTSLTELERNVDTAVAAQRIAVAQRPNVGSLSSLAIYEYFDGNFAAGDKAAKRAEADVPSKAEAKNIASQLARYRTSAKQFEKRASRIAKAEAGSGGEALQSPLGPIGAGGLR